jgi:cyanosortase A-associated protein
LALTFSSATLAVAKLTLLPKQTTPPTQTPNPLEITVPLPDWQFLDTAPLKTDKEGPFGQQYRYRQANQTLNVELKYMISDGNVSRYLFVYTPVRTANAKLKIKHQPGVGYYGVLSHKDHAYLSACINPRGESTVTEPQFTQNRYANDIQITRILPWLLGQDSLIDHRCLWTFMSIPLPSKPKPESPASATSNIVAEENYKELETAWFVWHRWWQSNFPVPL